MTVPPLDRFSCPECRGRFMAELQPAVLGNCNKMCFINIEVMERSLDLYMNLDRTYKEQICTISLQTCSNESL